MLLATQSADTTARAVVAAIGRELSVERLADGISLLARGVDGALSL